MSMEERKLRVEEKLTIKIGDAKNLLGGGNNGACGGGTSSTGKRDVYCTIALDQEEIYRTMQERTLSPFFDELFEFEVPRQFRYLSLYVWARDGHLKQQDKAVGKIAIRREELHLYNNKDHWFPLRPVDADSEVQGMAHIRVTVDHGAGHLRPKYDHGYSAADTENELDQINQQFNQSAGVSRSESCRTNTLSSGGSATTTSTLTKSRSLFGHADLNLFHTISARKASAHHHHRLRSSNLLHLAAKGRVSVAVTECVDLARKHGHCDPYVVCTATYTNGRVVKKRSKCRKKTTSPHFEEVLHFDLTANGDARNHDTNNAYTIAPLGGADLSEVCVGVWHSGGHMAEDVFLGEVRLPLRGKQQQSAVQASAWYFLQARPSQSRPAQSCATPPGTRLSVDNSLGSLRLKINYVVDQVFPLATYDALLHVLVESVAQRPVTTTLVYILGEVASKLEVAPPLVRLFTHQQRIAPMIRALADHEISKLTDPTTIFRGNTLVSKMMDEAMKLSGSQYLHATLRPIVDEIVAEKRPCEIDPARVKDCGQIEANLRNLSVYVGRVFEAITSSAVHCPAVLREVFHDLQECAAKHFPENKEIRYSVVSGFIFLRFFAPAILGPKLFDLTTRCAILDNQTNRTLTLISKTIQYLGNLVSSRSAQPCKEEYTGQLYRMFSTEEHIEAVKQFLEVISSIGDNEVEAAQPVLLKEGLMAKRAQGRNRFFRQSSFKPRYFRLTTHSLSYAKSKGQRTTCNIPLRDIFAVEQLHEKNFKLQNIIQIVKKDRPLFVQTSNCVEEKEWVDLLRKICQTNEDSRNFFHPCAYTNNVWSCCNESDADAEGCKAISTKKPFQLDLCTSLDPARDLQRLHSLIMRHMTDIEDLIATPIASHLHSNHVANGQDYVSMSKSCVLDERCRTTLQRVREIGLSLDHLHTCHRSKLAKDTKLGSKQAPIGEDNYLHMTRSNLIMQNGGAVPYGTMKESIIYPRSLTVYGNDYTTLGNGVKVQTSCGGAGVMGGITISTANSSPNSSITGGGGGGGKETTTASVTLLRQSPGAFSQ